MRADQRPDTSKNGMMKKRPLQVHDDKVKERGREVLSRLGKKREKK
ncbi:hypothetical protein T458_11995 [Brevibacillus panacihumi W25]|uniref:Uncharacterized protein n=1 Tax=Brevibacillus panacihumi W25 TaxID=1408254 RepID=V6M8C1_9BACL|nr:hypothetical protein [Brevibacillus panacihumi]EST54115.1 hypothetical protein T458_11995 [Brevibacillus panacihumi W25]